MVSPRAAGADPRRVFEEVRDDLLLPRAECVPPGAVGSGLSDQALGELAGFLQGLRAPHPTDQWVYIIQDNAGTHWTEAVRQWACAHRTVLVPSPTKASWLNPVECHAGDIQRLALPGQQFTTVEEVGRVLDAAVTYRNLERKERGKTFRDTVRADRRRRAKAPVWKRAS